MKTQNRIACLTLALSLVFLQNVAHAQKDQLTSYAGCSEQDIQKLEEVRQQISQADKDLALARIELEKEKSQGRTTIHNTSKTLMYVGGAITVVAAATAVVTMKSQAFKNGSSPGNSNANSVAVYSALTTAGSAVVTAVSASIKWATGNKEAETRIEEVETKIHELGMTSQTLRVLSERLCR